ncbi:hypothetical protein GP486_001045 [Trichoglossum hirsutum]|uniref:Uncharacterized protein n=1 Tax=Trichoglossum hirsutum TaxID=265104 RepID=A0A9P8LHN2_9PEZI|nr:hypothetical protein GP486_001045 [Trichoglossum hirsutum]
MSNYVYNVPPPYQHAGAALQNSQSGQYNYQQPPPGSTLGEAPAPTGALPNTAGNQYQYQVPPPVPPPPASFNTTSPPQGRWENPPPSQQQSWNPPAPQPPAPAAPVAAYNPGAYGPMPGAQQASSSPTRFSPSNSGISSGASNAGAGYNQNVQSNQGQSYGYGAVPQQPATAPPQKQYQYQPPSGQQWPQQQGSTSGQEPSHQQRPPPPLPPRPASVIGSNRPGSVIYAPQDQLHSSPVQTNAQLPQPTQTPQRHQSLHTIPGSAPQNVQSQHQQSDYYSQYQNQNQAPAPPPPKPQGYQQDGGQNQETQALYSNQQIQGYNSQPQGQTNQQPPSTGYQYNQSQGQSQVQQQPSQYGQYDTSAAPPIPSKTADGGYFPPMNQPQQGQNASQRYSTNITDLATDSTTSLDGWVASPNESRPVYVPPSLTGQGVSAYQPSNANPQPGVYIPPPPDNVPVWSQQQHAPLAPPQGAKRFKYTPPVLHPDYQPGGSKYNPQQAVQPTQPYQPDPPPQQQQPQGWATQPIEAQYPGQPGVEGWNQQVGGWQSVSHGDMTGVPSGAPPESQVSWGQQQEPLQGQNYQSQQTQQHQQQQHQQQHQSWGEHQVQHPPLSHDQQPHRTQQPPEQQQPIQAVSASIHSQDQQQQHQPHMSISEPYENANSYEAQRPPVTSPPGQNTVSPISQNPDAGQTSNEEKDGNTPLVSSNALSASALGFGGPGDWEHFGLSAEDESVDDTALTTKKDDPASPPENAMVELPASSSPTISSKEQPKTTHKNSRESEAWPTPPAPAPSMLNRTGSSVTAAVHDGGRYVPTPPPNNTSTHPHPERGASIVSIEDHDQSGSIDGAVQAWARQSQLTQQQRREAESQHLPCHPAAGQSFAIDDGAPSSPISQRESTIGHSDGNRSETPTQIQFTQQQQQHQGGNTSNTLASTSQSFVVDDGISGYHQQHEPNVSAFSQPTLPKKEAPIPLPAVSQSFVMDDGGWLGSAQVHEPTASAQAIEKPQTSVQAKPVPASQSFTVDDGSSYPVKAQQSTSPIKDPSPQQPLVQAVIQPVTASHPGFVVEDGVLSSQQLQPDSKKHVVSEPAALYPNLDPWYRASLERYAAMVNAESLAATDEERTKLFTDFMIEESRLRGVRYGVGIGPRDNGGGNRSEPGPSTQQTETSPQRGRRMTKPVSTDIPPAAEDDIEYSPGGRPRLRSQSAAGVHGTGSRSGTGISHPQRESVPKSSQSPATPPPPSQKYTVTAPSEQTNQPLSPSLDAPIPIESSEFKPPGTVAPSSPPEKQGNGSRPITPGSPKSSGSAPEKPAYIPFRPPAVEGPKISESLYKPYTPISSIAMNTNNQSTPATTDTKSKQPAYVPFAPPSSADTSSNANYGNARGSLPRKTSLDSASQRFKSGITKGREDMLQEGGNGRPAANNRTTASTPRRGDTIDVATARDMTGTAKRKHPEPILPSPTKRDSISQQGKDLIVDLERILPSNRAPKADGSVYIAPIKKCMDALPDDTNFIGDTIAAWEVKAKKVREAHDRERRIRQEEQEEHTDQLFSDKQIGYGDISALEEDFKLAEREKKSREDKEEYDSFVNEVFSRGYDHFQEEIKQLMEQYVNCMDLMKDAIAGKEALEAHNDKPDLSQIMAVFVALHKKIESRHEAVFQVVMERDKRFKKTIIQPLYSAGNIPEVKKMEKHFDEADKKSALEAAKKRDQRAKKFMQLIEENTVNTLRKDLNLMDEITQAVHKILLAPPPRGGNRSEVAKAFSDELVFAQTTLKVLAKKSEALMQSFHTAALEINAAEYDVSHASARLNNESPDTINRLREDMLKENDLLSKDLERRVSAVREDFQKANDEIVTLLSRLEKLKVSAATEQGSPENEDPEHKVRMKAALEEAKKRNAGSGGGPEDFS